MKTEQNPRFLQHGTRSMVLILLALVGSNPTAYSQAVRNPIQTTMVKDINPSTKSSNPEHLVELNGTLFFTASDGSSGRELFKSDGTEAGTALVKDIHPGFLPVPAIPRSSSPSPLTVFGNLLCFGADDGVHGRELWRSDGTEAGTVLVKDIRPGSMSSGLSYFTKVGDVLFFRANDGISGDELWKTDGTREGTALVKDIFPGIGTSFNNTNRLSALNFRFFQSGNTLLFNADDGVSGTELWKSDGTEGGTVRIADINPGRGSSDPRNLTFVGNTVFFTAHGGLNGMGLYCSDGTEAGTRRVATIVYSEDGWDSISLEAVGNTLFFAVRRGSFFSELWASDGTEEGTVLLKKFYEAELGWLRACGDSLVFRARSLYGMELWKSDGTAAGTQSMNLRSYTIHTHPLPGQDLLVAVETSLLRIDASTLRIHEISTSTGLDHMYYFALLGNRLLFVGTADTNNINGGTNRNGTELWQTDWTPAGTSLAADIYPGTGGSNPMHLLAIGEKLFFTAQHPSTGRELWMAVDTDKDFDGVPNDQDYCPASGLNPTVIINDVDSGVVNRVFDNGCSLDDLLASLLAESVNNAKNHGQLVNGLTHGLESLKEAGLISVHERNAIKACIRK